MITQDYVSYEIAKLLKEKGFEQHKCFHSYASRGFFKWSDILDPHEYAAPTHQMAMKWLRKVHNKHCDISYDINLKWFFQIIDLKETIEDHYTEMKSYHSNNQCNFKSYEDAVEAALKYSLENLI